MPGYRILSSDSHVVEPPTLWEERIDSEFKDRAPRVVKEDNTDQWYADVDTKFGMMGIAGQAGVRFEDPTKITLEGRFEDLPLGGYNPDAHIKDMELDSVYGGVMYPTQSFLGYSIPPSDLLSAIFRAYNDWLADFCAPYPDRLKGIAALNVDDVQDGVSELERAEKMGLVGGLIPVRPLEHPYNHPTFYEPLWEAAERLQMPLSLHVGTFRSKSGATGQVETQVTNVVDFNNRDNYMRDSVAALILGGVFDRYPELKVVVAEYEISWAPYFIRRLDDTYTERPVGLQGYRYKKDVLPSYYWMNNIMLSFQSDDLGIQLRHLVGVDNLMWGSDYPHAESTFPKSLEIVEQILEGVPDDEQAKIAGGNCARVYRFN